MKNSHADLLSEENKENTKLRAQCKKDLGDSKDLQRDLIAPLSMELRRKKLAGAVWEKGLKEVAAAKKNLSPAVCKKDCKIMLALLDCPKAWSLLLKFAHYEPQECPLEDGADKKEVARNARAIAARAALDVMLSWALVIC